MNKNFQLKSLVNRKVTFMYLFDAPDRFKGFRNEDLKKIDVINLSFGVITEGKLDVTRIPNAKKIIEIAHENGVRVVLSIGGWGAGGFSEAVSTKETRKLFVDSIEKVVNTFNYDGVDLDWEYPTTGVAGISASPNDRENFTLLVEELRKVFPNKLLTAAVPAGARGATDYYETAKLAKLLNYWHLMTYDMSGGSSSTHHTNLFASKYSNYSADQSVQSYANAGMPVEKMIMGIAFYGHRFVTTEDGDNHGLKVPAKREGSVGYRNIIKDYNDANGYKSYFDEEAQAPWLYGNKVLISYDNPQSIAGKCEYVNKHNLAGVMVWEYNADDDNSTLVNAIYQNIKK